MRVCRQGGQCVLLIILLPLSGSMRSNRRCMWLEGVEHVMPASCHVASFIYLLMLRKNRLGVLLPSHLFLRMAWSVRHGQCKALQRRRFKFYTRGELARCVLLLCNPSILAQLLSA